MTPSSRALARWHLARARDLRRKRGGRWPGRAALYHLAEAAFCRKIGAGEPGYCDQCGRACLGRLCVYHRPTGNPRA